MSRENTTTGGREATKSVIPGRFALSVGRPALEEPSGFAWTKLSDLARIESGHTPSRGVAEYWDGGIPWVGIRDATGNHGKTIYGTAQSITELGIEKSSARLLPAGTVCLSRTASVGYVIQMGVPMATSQDFVNWVCGPELSPSYLKYILVAEQESVRRFSHGTTHQTMYYPEAKALNVLVPLRQQQDAIVDVLGALDDKIAVNTKVAATAGNLAAAVFKRVVSEVPFSDQAFGELAKVSGGGTPSTAVSEYWNGDVHWATPTDVTALQGPYLTNTSRRISAAGLSACASELYPEGSILMTSRATIGAFALAQKPMAVNQGFIVVQPHNPELRFWFLHEMQSRVEEFVSMANGATFLELSRGNFKKFKVRLAEPHVIKQFVAMVGPLHVAAANALSENTKLTATRDVLLPQLMSGKLGVKDAEQALENAGA